MVASAARILFARHLCLPGRSNRDRQRSAPSRFAPPLDPAGNPRAGEPDEGGFDHMLAINEIVVVRFIDGRKKPAAELRRNADLHEFVFEVDDAIGLLPFPLREIVVRRIGIDAPLGALRLPAEIEQWVRIGRAAEGSGDDFVALRECDWFGGGHSVAIAIQLRAGDSVGAAHADSHVRSIPPESISASTISNRAEVASATGGGSREPLESRFPVTPRRQGHLRPRQFPAEKGGVI